MLTALTACLALALNHQRDSKIILELRRELRLVSLTTETSSDEGKNSREEPCSDAVTVSVRAEFAQGPCDAVEGACLRRVIKEASGETTFGPDVSNMTKVDWRSPLAGSVVRFMEKQDGTTLIMADSSKDEVVQMARGLTPSLLPALDSVGTGKLTERVLHDKLFAFVEPGGPLYRPSADYMAGRKVGGVAVLGGYVGLADLLGALEGVVKIKPLPRDPLKEAEEKGWLGIELEGHASSTGSAFVRPLLPAELDAKIKIERVFDSEIRGSGKVLLLDNGMPSSYEATFSTSIVEDIALQSLVVAKEVRFVARWEGTITVSLEVDEASGR